MIVLTSIPGRPQAGTGSVQGLVLDQTRAVVPAATLTLTNTKTNVSATTTSNEVGSYGFYALLPGPYRLTAEAAGMQKYEAMLTVQVQQVTAIEVVLTIGDVAVQVSVGDVTPLVTTEGPTLGHVLERQRIEQLPINGRNVAGLLSTAPGTFGGWGRAYGLRAGSADFVIDGVSTIDRTWGSWLLGGQRIALEAVEEFKVETNNSSAKFTRPITVVVSSRSGTNKLHGSVFETNRNSAVLVARRRQDLWSKAPYLNRNEWGASAGGPVWLPGVYRGKDRTFWFFTYEGNRTLSRTTRPYYVPTEAMRHGDFSGLRDSLGRQPVLYDPWSTDTTTWARQPFAHGGKLNVIDPARESPVAKYINSLTPLPNLPDVNPLVAPNLYMSVPSWTKMYKVSVRVDHNLSDKDRLFGQYARTPYSNRSSPNTYLSQAIDKPNVGQLIDGRADQTLSLSWVHTFSATLFNEFLLTRGSYPYTRLTGENENFADQLGLPNPLKALGFPAFRSYGLPTDFTNGGIRLDHQYNTMVQDNATMMLGKHELQFGFQVRNEVLNQHTGTMGSQPSLDFTTAATALYDVKTSRTNPQPAPLTGHALANMYLGLANYVVAQRRPMLHLRNREYAMYLQDNFRVSPRLTLNLGLRWELWPQYRVKDNVVSGFDTQKRAILLGRELTDLYQLGAALPSVVNAFQDLGVRFMTFQQAGTSSNMTDPNWRNFGPRLGFAYRLSGGARSAVIRGGYRISYNQIPMTNWLYQFLPNNIPFVGVFQSSLTAANLSPDGIANYGMRTAPRVIAGVNSASIISLDQATGITPGSAIARFFDRHSPDTRVQDWNFTLEKEILPNTLARATYVGNHASYLPQYNYFNDPPSTYVWYATTGQPTPTGAYANVAMRPYDQEVYGSLAKYGKWGWSNFNGVQLEIERRYSSGFGYQLFYVLGNAFATGNQDVDDLPRVPLLSQFLPGAAPADFHERNRFYNYKRDTSVPQHQLRWNWIVDLPLGRGKPLGRNTTGVLDKVIGGWQIAGSGGLSRPWFALPTHVYPTGQRVEIYGYQHPIEDCRSGVCYPGYLWWNGYISPNQINSYDANGKPNGIMGVPADYKPAGVPLIPWGSTALPPNAPAGTNISGFWNTNTVWVPLKNGTVQRTAYDDGLHPWRQQYFPSVRQWGLSASLFKTVPIGEQVKLRFNADFFNVLNHPGNPNSIGGDGVLSTRTSGQEARVTQLSARLTW